MENDLENEPNLNEKINIHSLPDHFIIAVFKYLSLKQLITCSKVCKKWNKHARDGSLWKKIDLKSYKYDLDLNNVKQIVNSYGSLSTREFSLSGSLNESHTQYSHKLVDLDVEFFDYLSQNCFNLSQLYLEYLDLTQTNLSVLENLPFLNVFSLKWCLINENWFKTSACLSVKKFYLLRTIGVKLTHTDIECICDTMPNLKSLTINQAESSIGDDSVEIICKRLIHLEELDLINTMITDRALLTICNTDNLCFNLLRLNLSMSSLISNSCLSIISESLQNLKSLYLTSCFGISKLEFFVNLKNLIYLNINNTSIDRQRIKDYLLPLLPNCEIEHGHEKMLNRKLMWTINGSRNSLCI